MNQMERYYVVSSTEEKDEEFAVIDAMSLDEANAIFEVRHKATKDGLQEGESFYIIQSDGSPVFDENNRLVFPKGKMAFIHRVPQN